MKERLLSAFTAPLAFLSTYDHIRSDFERDHRRKEGRRGM